MISIVCVCVSCLLCLTLCNPMDCSPSGPSVHGISRQEHWSGLPFPSPKGPIERKKVMSFSRVWLFVISWTVAYQAPSSMESSRQEYWSGVPLPSSLRCWQKYINIIHYGYKLLNFLILWICTYYDIGYICYNQGRKVICLLCWTLFLLLLFFKMFSGILNYFYLFTFGCPGSLLLPSLVAGVRASHCGGFSYCDSWSVFVVHRL